MTTAQTSTGYGPRHASRCNRLYFDGDESKYEIWEVKFLGYMRLQELLTVLVGSEEVDQAKIAKAYAELVQLLDDRSLALIIRDAIDDGRGPLKILRDYLGKSKPRIPSLYAELTSLKMDQDENVIDYVIRAEAAATSLKSSGETISDSLLIAMLLKGLPNDYKTFSTVITQKDEPISFVEFKVALRSFEETEKCHQTQCAKKSDNVMKTISKTSNNVKCYSCGKIGHMKYQCKKVSNDKSINNRWCMNYKVNNHDTKFCRRKKFS